MAPKSEPSNWAFAPVHYWILRADSLQRYSFKVVLFRYHSRPASGPVHGVSHVERAAADGPGDLERFHWATSVCQLSLLSSTRTLGLGSFRWASELAVSGYLRRVFVSFVGNEVVTSGIGVGGVPRPASEHESGTRWVTCFYTSLSSVLSIV